MLNTASFKSLAFFVFIITFFYRIFLHPEPLYQKAKHPMDLVPSIGYILGLGHISSNYLAMNFRDGTTIDEIIQHKKEIVANSDASILVMPGYPILGALVFLISGEINFYNLMLVHIFLDSIAAIMLMLITINITNDKTICIFAGLLYAFFPVFSQSCVKLQPGFLMPFFILTTLYFISRGLKSFKTIDFIIAAIILGISFNFRLTNLFVMVSCSLFIFIFLRKHENKLFKYKIVMIMIIVPILCLAPWVYRNYLVYNMPIISAGGSGSSMALISQFREYPYLYQDKDIPTGHGYNYAKKLGWVNKPKPGKHIDDDLNGIRLNSILMKYFISSVIEDPLKYVKNLALRFPYIISYHHIFSNKRLYKHPHDVSENKMHPFALTIMDLLPQWSDSTVKASLMKEPWDEISNFPERYYEFTNELYKIGRMGPLIWPVFLANIVDHIIFTMFILGIIISIRYPHGLVPLAILFGIAVSRTLTSIGDNYSIKLIYPIFTVYPIYLAIFIRYSYYYLKRF